MKRYKFRWDGSGKHRILHDVESGELADPDVEYVEARPFIGMGPGECVYYQDKHGPPVMNDLPDRGELMLRAIDKAVKELVYLRRVKDATLLMPTEMIKALINQFEDVSFLKISRRRPWMLEYRGVTILEVEL